MQYKNFKDGIELSRLGMGMMRLPVRKDQEGKPIDKEIIYDEAKEIIDEAMKLGINYYDTAYIYHGGESECFLGKALSEYPRDSYYVADKYNFHANPNCREEFAVQLERLQLDYIDFYLLHGVQDYFMDELLATDCIEYFDQLKKEGKIRYFGFSFHGSAQALKKMIGLYQWDFVQIQLNYYDWIYEEAKALYDILEQAGIPVMVMEPVRGGMLADLGEKGNAVFREAAPEQSVASWAIRWVKSLPGVQVVLSGMSNLEQLHDNVAVVSEAADISGEEKNVIEKACAAVREATPVPCTKCRYCCPECPMELDIPMLLSHYNASKYNGPWRLDNLKSLPKEKRPSACVGCGACMAQCPQGFRIPTYMDEMAGMMNEK